MNLEEFKARLEASKADTSVQEYVYEAVRKYNGQSTKKFLDNLPEQECWKIEPWSNDVYFRHQKTGDLFLVSDSGINLQYFEQRNSYIFKDREKNEKIDRYLNNPELLAKALESYKKYLKILDEWGENPEIFDVICTARRRQDFHVEMDKLFF